MVSGKTVPTVPVPGSGSVPEPPCFKGSRGEIHFFSFDQGKKDRGFCRGQQDFHMRFLIPNESVAPWLAEAQLRKQAEGAQNKPEEEDQTMWSWMFGGGWACIRSGESHKLLTMIQSTLPRFPDRTDTSVPRNAHANENHCLHKKNIRIVCTNCLLFPIK